MRAKRTMLITGIALGLGIVPASANAGLIHPTAPTTITIPTAATPPAPATPSSSPAASTPSADGMSPEPSSPAGQTSPSSSDSDVPQFTTEQMREWAEREIARNGKDLQEAIIMRDIEQVGIKVLILEDLKLKLASLKKQLADSYAAQNAQEPKSSTDSSDSPNGACEECLDGVSSQEPESGTDSSDSPSGACEECLGGVSPSDTDQGDDSGEQGDDVGDSWGVPDGGADQCSKFETPEGDPPLCPA